MSESTVVGEATAKSKPQKSAGASRVNSETLQFEMPKFALPAAFQTVAENSVAQAKENTEKLKIAAEEMYNMLEDTYSRAAKGAVDCALKAVEVARVNTTTTFDLAGELMTLKLPLDVIAFTTAHARKQFDLVSMQNKEIWALAQKVATDAAEPIRSGISKIFRGPLA
jgi:phasin